jgi:MraZ protein
MFLGEYQHTLDPKGRVVLPAKFRDGLADGCVITKGQERCLYVFPLDRWETEVERVNTLPRTDARTRKLTRSFFAGADQQSPDKQGRVQIPAKLRTYADLSKDLTVVGVADYIEIWDTATWSRMSAEADDYYADIEEALGEHGI